MFNKEIYKGIPLPTWLLMALALLLCPTDSAQAQSLGTIICNAYANSVPIGQTITMVSYCGGVIAAVQSIYHFRGYTESPQNFPLHRAVILALGAAVLLALPSLASAIIESFFPTQLPAGGIECAPPQGGGGTSGGGLDVMMSNFINDIKRPMQSIVSIIADICGFLMIARGVSKASKYGFDPKTNSIHSIVTHLVFGALLLAAGDSANAVLDSLFGGGMNIVNSNVNTHLPVTSWKFVANMGSGSAQFASAITSALIFVQIIGLISFVRGLLVMKKVVEGGGQVTAAQGITHIVGGALAINITGFLQAMDASFGTGLM